MGTTVAKPLGKEDPLSGHSGSSSMSTSFSDLLVPTSPAGPPSPSASPQARSSGDVSEDLSISQTQNAAFLGSIGSNVSRHSPFLPWQEMEANEELRRSHPCGIRGGWFIELATGRQFPARCKLLRCDYCLPKEAGIRQLILAESMPDTMWSQTMVAEISDPDPWSTIRYRMNLFFGFYRRKAKMRELSYTVEMNPQGTGYHIHALCHGPKWDIDVLRSAQESAGLGLYGNHWNPIGKIHDSANYGMKGFRAAGYGLKGYTAVAARREALRINGMRLEHHTRGFIRVNGEPVGMPAARRAIMLKKYGVPLGDFHWYPQPMMEWQFDAYAWRVARNSLEA